MSSSEVKGQCGLSIKVVCLAVVARHHNPAFKVLAVYQNLVICPLQLRVIMYRAHLIPVFFSCLWKQKRKIYKWREFLLEFVDLLQEKKAFWRKKWYDFVGRNDKGRIISFPGGIG